MRKYSLISTLFNEENNIVIFLESYKKQTRKADEYIIVDGGSTDKTAVLIETFSKNNPELNIRLIVDKTCSKKYAKGPVAKGRNVAIKEAQYDYIVVTDAGCILSENWFENIVKPFEDDDTIDVIGGWCEGLKNNDYQIFYSNYCMPTLKTIDKEKFLPSSRNIAFKKDAWGKAGKYPESTLTAEDSMFDLNLKKVGCRFYFNENAIVYWDLPKNVKESYYKLYKYGYGDGQYGLFKDRYFLRFLCIVCPIKFIKLLFTKPKYFIWKWISLVANVLGYISGLLNRV